MSKAQRPILLSAGGTGGHLFPAEALAQELLSRGRRVAVVTDKRGHAFRSLGPLVPVMTVRAAALKDGVLKKILAAAKMAFGVAQAVLILLRLRPVAVVGFGGYPSFPAVFAAQMLRIPTILHEQNAIMGRANAVLAPRALAIAASLPGTRNVPAACQTRVTVTGNPVRAPIAAVRAHPYAPPSGRINLLVTGGSQGASIFGTVVPDAVARLPQDLRDRLSVTHQCREGDIAEAFARYKVAGVEAEIAPFFVNMAALLQACHIFIGRSGASTVSEIAVAGRPALFVPMRHADRQQTYNAEVLSGAGGAALIPQENFTPESLAEKLRELIENPDILARMAKAAEACGRPEATARLADLVEQTTDNKKETAAP